MKTITVEDDTHKRAKILSAKTGMTIKEILALLVLKTSEKEIEKLAQANK